MLFRSFCEEGERREAGAGEGGGGGEALAGEAGFAFADEGEREVGEGREIARGMTNYDSDSLTRIRGLKSHRIAQVLGEKLYDEAVHRNNMTLR